MSEEPEFVTITPPTLPSKAVIDVKGTTLTIGPADSGEYASISIDQTSVKLPGNVIVVTPGILEVSGGDVVLYLTGNLLVGESCNFHVAVDSSLTIYTDGDITCRANSDMGYQGQPQEPEHLKIYGTSTASQDFDIKAKGFWSAAIYAPNADVGLNAGGDLYGSITSNSFDLKSSGNFYYDEALKYNVTVDDVGVQFEVARWRDE